MNPEHDVLLAEVDQYVAGLDRSALPADLEKRFARLVAEQAALDKAGLAVVAWPERFGGRGLGPAEAAIVAGLLGKAGAPETINFVALEVVAPALMRHASEEQLLQWLPPMAPAEKVWCQLFSEPDAGSDLAALRTRAEPDGDDWIVTGTKLWCTWGQFADLGLLLARTGSTDSRHRGITAFVIEMNSPGIEVRPLRSMTGVSEFAEVVFDGARVAGTQIVGTVDQGWAVAMDMLSAERGSYAVRRASVVSGALSALLDQAGNRQSSTVERDLLVKATIKMRLLDLRIEEVVRQLEAGESLGPEAAVTKLLLTEAEQTVMDVCHRSLDLQGIAWTGDEHPWVEAYLYSLAASIYGGASEIQRNTIGERLLGLPREPN